MLRPGHLLVVASLLSLALPPTARSDMALSQAAPGDVGMDAGQLDHIDQVVAEGLAASRMPGCVVCVGRRGKIVFRRAYGHKRLEPEKVPMTVDTVFDMASITKPVATATSVMLLIERGQVRLRDKVAEHLPEFATGGKEDVTVEDLLLHQGGLIPDNALADYEQGPEEALRRVFALELRSEPGTKFTYSDVGFIVLGELVRRKTGQDAREFSRTNIFEPLGMRETGFLPSPELRARAAPTEQREGRWMQGEVHDPRAYALGGVAGHAGLFSTADDLAIYAQMLLNRGTHQGRRVLGPATVETMTRAYPVSSGVRGLGWDKLTGYSSNRGELMSERAFGHGGFTGTALWIDPRLELFVIFLSNRVHPDGKGSVNPLAGRIATIAAAAVSSDVDTSDASPLHPHRSPEAVQTGKPSEPKGTAEVLTGIDVLQRDGFRPLAGRRVGLITNHTGVNRAGKTTVQILHEAKDVTLVSLFSPEHGFAGQLDQAIVKDSQEANTGLTIHSLYGATRKPTAEMLRDIDTLVFDIQDIGARFYTYVSTMGEAMQAAAEHRLKFVVLDRPNPINGQIVDGPVLDTGRESFVGFHAIPVRHGMTVGELARLFNAELRWNLDLEVVPVEGWDRRTYFDQTGLLWINPSPNMRSLTQALLYPGIGLLETTNLSVGRGTDTPFEVIGAPWLDGQRLAMALNEAGLPGARFVPLRFTPDSSKFANESCGGVNILITQRDHFDSTATGWEIARQLRLLYPDTWEVAKYDRLLSSEQVLSAVTQGATRRQIRAIYQEPLEQFQKRRRALDVSNPAVMTLAGRPRRSAIAFGGAPLAT